MERVVKTWTAIPSGAHFVPSQPPAKRVKTTRTCLISEDPRFEESISEYDCSYEDEGVPSVYEDRYVRITENHVTIKKYFFPDAQSKIIPITSIQRVKILGPSFRAPKWGIDVDRKTWWAYDYLRNEKRDCQHVCGLIFDVGENVQKGTTVLNFEEVLQAVKCQRHVIEY